MLLADFPPTNEYPLCLSQEQWLRPKTVFQSFFKDHDYLDLKKTLRDWLKATRARRPLPKKKIPRIDDAQEHLLLLLEAGYLLEGEENSTLPEGCNWMDTRWWLGEIREDEMPFDYFPRSLSKKEYRNPYRVFYACRSTNSLPEWRLLLRDCFTAGICGDVLSELHSFDGALDAYRLLPKLVEAAYLIYIREFYKQADTSKSK